jgi:flagellar hook-associated protein 1 FlgK
MKNWSYVRGSDPTSSLTDAGFDDYYRAMIGSMGIKSRSIKNSKAFSDTMVEKMTEQRNSVSAVSLDEEMVNLMKYQHAFAAASKLIKVSDEMLNTLISVR